MPHTTAQRFWSRGDTEGMPLPLPTQLTAFEEMAERLGLSDPGLMVASAPLRQWAKAHRNKRYIPEWLLNAWKIHVIADDCN